MAKNSKKYVKPELRIRTAKRTIDTSNSWRSAYHMGDKTEWSGLQVWVPIDPYSQKQREMFRVAMANPYVWRANRIIANWVTGQGYTTQVVPRKEEEIPQEQQKTLGQTKIKVPYFNNDEKTYEEIKDFVDKLTLDVDLPEQIRNGYFTSREQGRSVLALTPIDRDDDGRLSLPDSIRFIRPEYTLRPYLDMNTAELVGVQIVGLISTQATILPVERMIYITHDFNQELFSDYYGDSAVERISDAANVLNIIFADDFVRAAEHTWHQPKVFRVEIPPQDFGQEESVLDEFLLKNNNSQGQDIAVTQNVELANPSTNSGDIGGLETIVVRCIKAILAYYNLPGFMLSEGDIGKLGGNANTEEIDMFINTEINPEKTKVEKMLESQWYDKILCILFDTEDPDSLPIKIKHTYNKPTIASLFRPDLYEVAKDMVINNIIDKQGLIKLLNLEPYVKETMTTGESSNPADNTWRKALIDSWNKSPVNINVWTDKRNEWGISKMPIQWNKETNQWEQQNPVEQWGTRGSMPKGWKKEDNI